MTGYQSKKAAAQDKLEDDDTQIYQTELTKLLMESYDRGVADALAETKAAPPQLLAHIKFLEDELLTVIADGYYSPLHHPTTARPWVGLTDEDCKGMSAGDRVVAMWADRTLKEKNSGTTP